MNKNFLWICLSTHYVLQYCGTKFQEILLSGFSGVALKNCFSMFYFGQISKFKKGVIPIKKLNQNFLWICASTHYVLHNYKVSWNSVERFQRSCADKKNRTDGLTDWRTGQKHYTLRNSLRGVLWQTGQKQYAPRSSISGAQKYTGNKTPGTLFFL